jgi:hypothetical protein
LTHRCLGDEIPDLELDDSVGTCGCGGYTMFEVPYERSDGSRGLVTACAACDLGIRWPRLAPADAVH